MAPVYSGKDLGARENIQRKNTDLHLTVATHLTQYFDSIATKVGFASGNKVPIYFKPRGYFSCHGV